MTGASGYISRDHVTNIAFGLTFLNLAAVGLCTLGGVHGFLFAARLGALAVNAVMGVMLLFNNRSTSAASPLHKPYWLGMIACNVAVVKLIEEGRDAWCVEAGVFFSGVLMVILSLVSIGRSFAVTPMRGRVRTRLAYRFVRHPMYLGETLMLAACIAASRSIIAVTVLVVYAYFMTRRILLEEELLSRDEEYRRYCARTRWRLLPWVW